MPIVGEVHILCDCCEPKFFNSQPIDCEMNKFDDMMAFLRRSVPSFSQVVAVDESFDLFWRAWCVAELVNFISNPWNDNLDSNGYLKVYAFHNYYGRFTLFDILV